MWMARPLAPCSRYCDCRIVLRLLVSTYVTISAAASISCSEERSQGPCPERDVLYVASWGMPHARIEAVDIKTDSILYTWSDTAFGEVVDIRAFPDGRHLMVFGAYNLPLIWNVELGTTVATLPRNHYDFVITDDFIVGFSFDGVDIYSAVTHELINSNAIELFYPVAIPGTDLIAGMNRRFLPWEDRSFLVVFDLDQASPVDTIVVNPDQYGRGFQFQYMTASQDGRVLYCRGAYPEAAAYLLAIDWSHDSVLYQSRATSGIGFCEESPDGKEVWITNPGVWNGLLPPTPGTIQVFDAEIGDRLVTISTAGHTTPATWPMPVREIEFSTDGRLCFVNALNGEHPILVIDVVSRSIVRDILGSPRRVIQAIELTVLHELPF